MVKIVVRSILEPTPLYLTWVLTLECNRWMKHAICPISLPKGPMGGDHRIRGSHSSAVHCRKQGTTGTTSQEMTESKPESLNLLPNQGARMRPKWQTFHHLCCNGSGDLILSFIPIMGSHLVEWPKKGLIMLLTLSVNIHDNAYKGQCLSSPTLILHRHITFIPSWISAGLLSTLYLLHSISHTCQLLFLIRIL